MDLFQIISDIEKVDPEVYQRFDSRRRAFKYLGDIGKKVTAATLPAVLGTMFNKAYGQSTGDNAMIGKVLNLALSLEYLEFYFYDSALNSTALTLPDRAAIEIIRNDESGHIKTLRQALTAIGQTPIADPTRAAFDYSGGSGSGTGPFAAVFSNTALFYGVARSFVDTGIRAYKGGAPLIMSNKDILEAALNIHSVEARHASHIRAQQRGGTGVAGDPADLINKPKSWISGVDQGGASPNTTPSTAAIYNAGAAIMVGSTSLPTPAESNVTHLTVNVQTTTTYPTIPGVTLTTAQQAAAASEAFDEPLDAETVKTIARNFRSTVGATLGLFNAG